MPVAGDLGLLGTNQRKNNEFPTEIIEGEDGQHEADMLTFLNDP